MKHQSYEIFAYVYNKKIGNLIQVSFLLLRSFGNVNTLEKYFETYRHFFSCFDNSKHEFRYQISNLLNHYKYKMHHVI